MQSIYYPFAEFHHCNPDSPDDPFPSRVYRYARSLAYLLGQRDRIGEWDCDFFTTEEKFHAFLSKHHSALIRVTGLRCTIVDEILDSGESCSGWSEDGWPLLTGVAVQLSQMANPDTLRAREALSKSCEIFATRLARYALEVTVYDTRDSGRLSNAALKNTSLMAALAAPMLTYNLQTLRRMTAVESLETAHIGERTRLFTEQRERSINTGIWMLASANFGTFSMQQVRRTLIDVALSSANGESTWGLFETALTGSRKELIALSEHVAGPLA